MALIQRIQKSRKETRCSRCGKIIPVGNPYLKAEINFGPTIRRCTDCGLESWEITTSDFKLRVGELVYRWRQSYDASEEGVEEMISELESIHDETEEKYDNLPEGIQDSDLGNLLQERMDMLDSARSDLEDIDYDTIKAEIVRDEIEQYAEDEDEDLPGWYDKAWRDKIPDDLDYDTLLEKVRQYNSEESSEMEQAYASGIEDLVEEALSNLEV